MPRNVRNFWVELSVDGRATDIASGPRASSGGIDIDIYQRDRGDVRRVLNISGRPLSGKLYLRITDPETGKLLAENVTIR